VMQLIKLWRQLRYSKKPNSHTHIVVLDCCENTNAGQWGKAKFNPKLPPNHITDQ